MRKKLGTGGTAIMGQHKYNPTAIAAKNKEIKPKAKIVGNELTRNEQKKLFYDKLSKYFPSLPTKPYF